MLAAVTHPHFKSTWVDKTKELEVRIKLKNLFTDAVTPVIEKSTESLAYDFVNFSRVSNTSPPDEVNNYLNDNDCSLAMLDSYPRIRELFIKYNSAIPSSAAVERLFSQGSLVLTLKRNSLSDSLLEMLLLLKISLNM